MKENIVELINVSKNIGNNKIIHDLSFSINEGEIFGLLGPNGSGKTTTLRMLVDLTTPTSGEIKICGFNVHKNHSDALKNVGAIIENPEMYDYMTGYQNLKYYSRMANNVCEQDILEMAKLLDLEGALKKKVKNYSLGMKQRLGIAQALLHKPKVLILDEPTNGLDPAGIRDLRKQLKVMAHEKNMSIIVSSHLLSEIEKMCDRVAIIKEGKMLNIENLGGKNNLTNLYYTLKLKPFESAVNYLKSQKYVFSQNDEDCIIAIDSNSLLKPIPEIIKEFVYKDIEVHEVSKSKRTLEDIFMDLTEKGDEINAKSNN